MLCRGQCISSEIWECFSGIILADVGVSRNKDFNNFSSNTIDLYGRSLSKLQMDDSTTALCMPCASRGNDFKVNTRAIASREDAIKDVGLLWWCVIITITRLRETLGSNV